MRKLIIALLVLCGTAFGQGIIGNGLWNYAYSAPSGSCGQNAPPTYVIGVGTVYTCQSGTWAQVGGSSGSGTVSPNSGTAGAVANYAAAGGSTTVGPDANLTDASSILTYTGSNGIALTTGGNTGDIKLLGTTLHLGGATGSGPVQVDGPLDTTYFVNLIGSGIYDANSSFGNAGAILTPAASGAGASGTGVAWTTQAAFTNTGATLTLGSVGGNTGTLALLGTTSGSVAWTCNPTTTCGTMQTSAAVSMGKASSGAFVSNGTKFTTNQGCGENTSTNLVGGASAGTITTAGSTSCTTIVTIGGSLSSSNGWSCTVIDLTTAGDLTNPHQTASSTTTATFVTGTIVSGDKLQFSCVGY